MKPRLLQSKDEVIMDDCHIDLIAALVSCSKPGAILELGIGSGAVTKALLDAIGRNQQPATLTCVDNFLDWGGNRPDGVNDFPCSLVIRNEKDFVAECENRYDFIVSDADHEHSHEWFHKTMGLLNEGGVAVFHDVCNPDYPNLASLIQQSNDCMFTSAVFNQSSREDERCHRGLLVVFKN